MSGLVFRNLFLYYRKMTKAAWFAQAAALLLFAAVMPKNVFSVIGYLFIITPLNMASPMSVFKEIDNECQEFRFERTLPYTKTDIVRARFLFSFLVHSFYTGCMILFSLIHGLRSGMPPIAYVKAAAVVWLVGIIIISVDLFLNFFSRSGVVLRLFNFTAVVILMSIVYAEAFSAKINGSYEVFGGFEPYVYWTLGTVAVFAAAGSYKICLKII